MTSLAIRAARRLRGSSVLHVRKIAHTQHHSFIRNARVGEKHTSTTALSKRKLHAYCLEASSSMLHCSTEEERSATWCRSERESALNDRLASTVQCNLEEAVLRRGPSSNDSLPVQTNLDGDSGRCIPQWPSMCGELATDCSPEEDRLVKVPLIHRRRFPAATRRIKAEADTMRYDGGSNCGLVATFNPLQSPLAPCPPKSQACNSKVQPSSFHVRRPCIRARGRRGLAALPCGKRGVVVASFSPLNSSPAAAAAEDVSKRFSASDEIASIGDEEEKRGKKGDCCDRKEGG